MHEYLMHPQSTWAPPLAEAYCYSVSNPVMCQTPPPSNVLEICNVVIFNFYQGLPYRRSLQGEKLQNSLMCLHMQILIWLPAAHADPVKPGPPKIWSSKETYLKFKGDLLWILRSKIPHRSCLYIPWPVPNTCGFVRLRVKYSLSYEYR